MVGNKAKYGSEYPNEKLRGGWRVGIVEKNPDKGQGKHEFAFQIKYRELAVSRSTSNSSKNILIQHRKSTATELGRFVNVLHVLRTRREFLFRGEIILFRGERFLRAN